MSTNGSMKMEKIPNKEILNKYNTETKKNNNILIRYCCRRPSSSRLMKAIFSWDKVFIELPAQANVQLETIGFQKPPFPHLGGLPCRCQ